MSKVPSGKPRIGNAPAATHRERAGERIIKFTSGDTHGKEKGGLISFRDDGRVLTLDVYLLAGPIDVLVPMKHLVRNPDVAKLITALHLAHSALSDVVFSRKGSEQRIARQAVGDALKHFGDVLEVVVAEENMANAAE